MSRCPPIRKRSRTGAAAAGTPFAVLALVLSLLASPAGAADFGRVFFSPAQRAAMTALRDRPPPETAPGPVAAAAAPQRLDGILRRPDGRSIVWLDGQPQVSPAGYRLPAGRALILIPDDAPATRLRVGDSWPRSDQAEARLPHIVVQGPAGVDR